VSLRTALVRKKPAIATDGAPGVEPDEEQRYGKIDLKLVRRLAGCLRPFTRLYVTGVLLGLVHITMEMIGPKIMQWLIRFTLAEAAIRTTLTPTQMKAAEWHTAMIVGIWALVLGISVIFLRVTIITMTAAGERVQFSIRRRLFLHLQKLSMSYYDKTKLGRIISRCTSDIDAMREVNVWGLWKIVANSLQIVVAAIMIASIAWR
jgi:ABC-type multidrug transport system fused ATPase/permease subunit